MLLHMMIQYVHRDVFVITSATGMETSRRENLFSVYSGVHLILLQGWTPEKLGGFLLALRHLTPGGFLYPLLDDQFLSVSWRGHL